MALTDSEKARLKVVLDHAHGDLSLVHEGVRLAITDIPHDKTETRAYLWRMLSGHARRAIQRTNRKTVPTQATTPDRAAEEIAATLCFEDWHSMLAEAAVHEQELLGATA